MIVQILISKGKNMPNIELGDPYEAYVKGLIGTGLYSTYAEVVKDALRLHMDHETQAKRIALANAGIAEGETDIKAGRTRRYTPALIDELTAEVVREQKT